jgi:hypothetical protein
MAVTWVLVRHPARKRGDPLIGNRLESSTPRDHSGYCLRSRWDRARDGGVWTRAHLFQRYLFVAAEDE